MIDKPFESLSYADVLALIAAGRGEDRRLEFKRDLTAGSDAAKKEYLADLSSLANAQGGDLIFGIEEAGGVAIGVPGVALSDSDAEILRLEQLALSGLQPRILGLRSVFLPDAPGSMSGVLVQRVPASLNAPHRVVFQQSGRFYTRHSRGKSEMGVVELREAFMTSDGVLPRLRSHHRGLENLLFVDQVPGAQLALTIAPLALARRQEMLEFSNFQEAAVPPMSGSLDYAQTLEGFLVWTPTGDSRAYSQVLSHRAGYVEGLSSQSPPDSDSRDVWLADLTEFIRRVTQEAVNKLGAKGISGPWVLMTTLYGVAGGRLHIGHRHRETRPTKRDRFDFRELVFENFEPDTLIPLMRQIWWAYGRERPADFDIKEG